ncbi:MAG: hypothetical protein AB7J40_05070 [Candidatus Altimarinota bacterium]
MFKKIFQIGLVLCLLFQTSVGVSAASVQECKEEMVRSLETVMGVPGRSGLNGYLSRLSDLTSTNMATYLLIDQVQQLARDAQMELKNICREVERFDQMSRFYSGAYQFDSCRQLNNTNSDTAGRLEVIDFCDRKSDELLDSLLESLEKYLLEQAIRTSIEPLVIRMRSLNERLIVLASQYSRLINNFYTFSLRLGDTIIGERD